MKNSGKEFGLPLNLDIKNKLSLQSNASKGPPSPKQPFFIGVAGGTASGKTTVCNLINTQLHDQRIVLINQVINLNNVYSEIMILVLYFVNKS
ncbi:uridine/cytidine kinase [Trifolium repens]|nr:uridine/cytidine kinase [Trifolium repens]